MQREPRHPVDMKRLEKEDVEEFRRVFTEELGDGPTSGGEEVWITFKEALREVQSCLPWLQREREEKDWVIDEVQ